MMSTEAIFEWPKTTLGGPSLCMDRRPQSSYMTELRMNLILVTASRQQLDNIWLRFS